MMVLYIAGWFVLIVVGLAAFSLRFAPDEVDAIRAMVAARRARKKRSTRD